MLGTVCSDLYTNTSPIVTAALPDIRPDIVLVCSPRYCSAALHICRRLGSTSDTEEEGVHHAGPLRIRSPGEPASSARTRFLKIASALRVYGE
jgi:hypothetical protein